MSGVKAVQMTFDFPAAEPTRCHRCDPAMERGEPCDSCWEALQARVAVLMAGPEVVAILARIPSINSKEEQLLHDAALANYRRYRTEQVDAKIRVRDALGSNWRDPLSAKQHVYLAAKEAGLDFFVVVAAEDAAYGYMVGDLLTEEERRLFTKPWTDVLGKPTNLTERSTT